MTEKPELRSSNPDQKVILIAEDDVVVRSIAQIVLEAAGYLVILCCQRLTAQMR